VLASNARSKSSGETWVYIVISSRGPGVRMPGINVRSAIQYVLLGKLLTFLLLLQVKNDDNNSICLRRLF
jgi:hypothetical protein